MILRRRSDSTSSQEIGGATAEPNRGVLPGRCRRPRGDQRRRLRVESLEDRTLLAADLFPMQLEAVRPLGSLIYTSSASTAIDAADETDRFTVELDDGQSMSVVVGGETTLHPTLVISDPGGTAIGSATAASPGETAVLQAVPVTEPGIYTLTVSGLGGTTGSYSAQLIFNAMVDQERHGGGANDGIAQAQNLDASFIPLGVDSAARGAVLGSLEDGDAADWYQFSLADGTSTTLALTLLDTPARMPSSVTIDFQQGVDSYSGTSDTYLTESSPDWNRAAARSLNVDSDDPGGTGLDVQALVRFDDIFGTDSGQVRSADEIVSAWLDLQVTDGGDPIALHRMLVAWDDSATWNTFTGEGITADDGWAVRVADAVTPPPETGRLSIDVTESLRAWQRDPSTNFGWVLLPTGNGGVDFISTEGAVPPKLRVERRVADPPPLLELFDTDGRRLAQGTAGAQNVDQVISDFVDTTDDDVSESYFARISGEPADYSLLVTRGANFDTEDNDAIGALAQPIDVNGTVLGSTSIAGNSVTFAVIGDYGVGGGGEENVANMIKETDWDVDFVVTTGDNNYWSTAVGGDWESVIGQYYGDFIQGRSDNLYPLQTSTIQRFFPTPGNHDSLETGGYLDYFNFDPENSARLPRGVHNNANSYYDVEIPIDGGGSVQIFAMDGTSALFDADSMRDQKAWLERRLAESTATWKFVFFHEAAYSSSTFHGNNRRMQWDFEAWGADAVFSGHDHTYERIIHPDDGLLYFVTGLGGRGFYGLGEPIPGSQAMYNDSFGSDRSARRRLP
ncbi:MAG: metallophosphoesterase [Pirellulales bacterium]